MKYLVANEHEKAGRLWREEVTINKREIENGGNSAIMRKMGRKMSSNIL